ncbi:MAG: M20 family metallopeptidase [Solirubrobacteraceae bacterium]|nr:M20 family metallopeptidase [Solirubrobacteraceae bacterium]
MSIPEVVSADAPLRREFLTHVLSSLVSTPSVNPGVFEAAMAAQIAAWMAPTGARIEHVEFAPGRPSVAAVLGDGDGPRLVLNGHMDTVPVDDTSRWDSDPFEPVIRDGFLYGRGACDMKAGLAVQIAVAHHLAALGALRGSLVLHFAAGEECGEPGTLSLLEAGYRGDYGIVTEPTQVQVSVATRGIAYYRIRIRGRSIHASRAHLGINPLPRLARVLDAVQAYHDEVAARHHSLLPGGSCTPTVVRGGVKENAVADWVELLLDRRLLPGETVEGEMADLRRRLEALGERDPDLELSIEVMGYSFEPAEIPADSRFAGRVASLAAELCGRSGEICGTPYGSDVRNLVNDAGIEAITFGPGNVAECHCANERVAVDEVVDAATVIAAVAREMLR